MAITTDMVRTLRERSGAGIMDCKKALEQSNGDVEKAEEFLRAKGIASAEKKATRATNQGLVESYVHSGGRIGAMVELNCETDFVSRTPDFKALAHNLAMQVAAMKPKYLDRSEMPAESAENPEEVCLLQQPFIRDAGRSIQDLVTELTAKIGENIRVKRFSRFELGE
ncbi:MAG: translation elongation factor Ts [Chloroflexi bacterium]|nr:translation elongation factor Ts [Chloroflexota bacterium]